MRKSIITVFIFFALGMPVSTECAKSVNAKKITQVGLQFAQLGLGLLVDTLELSDVFAAKKLVLGNLGVDVLDAASKVCDYSCNVRNEASVGLHAHALLWKLAKASRDYKILSKMQEKDELFLGTNETNEISDARDKSLAGKFLLRLAKLGFSFWATFGNEKSHGKYGGVIGQSVCDLLLRYLYRSEKKFGNSQSDWVDKMEMVAGTVPHCYDAIKAIHDLNEARRIPAKRLEKINWDDVCKACGRTYGKSGGVACRMSKCGHNCCADCAEKDKTERAVTRKVAYFSGGEQIPDDIVDEMHEFEKSCLDCRFVPDKTETVVRCPCCRDGYQSFTSKSISEPEKTEPEVNPEEEDDDDSECCLCMERPNAKKLGCDHEFCLECITNWYQTKLRTKDEPTCPMCRAPFDL